MILIKTKKEIDVMRQAGRILSQVMKDLEKKLKPSLQLIR